jgi:HrpA-like RNA helicase
MKGCVEMDSVLHDLIYPCIYIYVHLHLYTFIYIHVFFFKAQGACYRLYTEETFDSLEEDTMPEIKQCPMANAVLLLKAYGIDNILGFDFMDKPSRDSLVHAMEQLYALSALNEQGLLTDLGRNMAELPLDPVYSRIMLMSKVNMN